MKVSCIWWAKRAERDFHQVPHAIGHGRERIGIMQAVPQPQHAFTGENLHDVNCRNPHDPDHMTGRSSSGWVR
jgi:hypothetical protein